MSRYVDISPYEKCRIVSNPEDNGFPVSELPTVDAEPVVRCKDCKYFDGEPGQPNIQCGQMHEDDFCSYGERRSSNK